MRYNMCDVRKVFWSRGVTGIRCLVAVLCAWAVLSGCSKTNGDTKAVEATIMRYNRLLIEGYRTFNMNSLQEVATPEQATKLYFHMSALGEGKLRMDSTLKDIKFLKVEFPKPDEATVETKETWDFTHVNISTGKKFSEEKDFIYVMGYSLKKDKGRWIIRNVNTVSGESTNTVIPWPELDRKGNTKRPATGTEGGKPAGHP